VKHNKLKEHRSSSAAAFRCDLHVSSLPIESIAMPFWSFVDPDFIVVDPDGGMECCSGTERARRACTLNTAHEALSSATVRRNCANEEGGEKE